MELIVAIFLITEHKRYCFLSFPKLVVLDKCNIRDTNVKKVRLETKGNEYIGYMFRVDSVLSVF